MYHNIENHYTNINTTNMISGIAASPLVRMYGETFKPYVIFYRLRHNVVDITLVDICLARGSGR